MQFRRIEAIAGADEAESRNRWLTYLRANLRLPCEVAGGAVVRRKSDGARFVLGLSELRAVKAMAGNHEILDDYAVWLANSRWWKRRLKNDVSSSEKKVLRSLVEQEFK